MEEKMKKQDTQEDVQVKTEEELSQVAGGGATMRSPCRWKDGLVQAQLRDRKWN